MSLRMIHDGTTVRDPCVPLVWSGSVRAGPTVRSYTTDLDTFYTICVVVPTKSNGGCKELFGSIFCNLTRIGRVREN